MTRSGKENRQIFRAPSDCWSTCHPETCDPPSDINPKAVLDSKTQRVQVNQVVFVKDDDDTIQSAVEGLKGPDIRHFGEPTAREGVTSLSTIIA